MKKFCFAVLAVAVSATVVQAAGYGQVRQARQFAPDACCAPAVQQVPVHQTYAPAVQQVPVQPVYAPAAQVGYAQQQVVRQQYVPRAVVRQRVVLAQTYGGFAQAPVYAPALQRPVVVAAPVVSPVFRPIIRPRFGIGFGFGRGLFRPRFGFGFGF